MLSTDSSENPNGGPQSRASSLPATQASSYITTVDSTNNPANISAINDEIRARSDKLGSGGLTSLSLRSESSQTGIIQSYAHATWTTRPYLHDKPEDNTSMKTENFIPEDPVIQADVSTLQKRKFASSSFRAKRSNTRPKLADFNAPLPSITGITESDNDSIPSSPPAFNPQHLKLDVTRANTYRASEFDVSPAYNSSPLLPPNNASFQDSDTDSMSYNNKMLSDAELNAQIDNVTKQTGSMGLHPSSAGNNLPGGDGIDTDNGYRGVSKKDDLTGGLLSGDADDDEEEEMQLTALPSSRLAPAAPAEEDEDNRVSLTPEDIENHFLDMIDPIYDLLAKCKTDKEAVNVRKAAIRKLLPAYHAMLKEAYYYDKGNLPRQHSDSFLQYEMKLFAAKPLCPWGFIRILVHIDNFKTTVRAFQELLCQFVDELNACIPETNRRAYGLDKEAFLCAISKALCLNMVPGLHLVDAAVPKLEQKLELVDSFYDPVCLFEHPDEDETPEFGAARRKYRDFTFIEKVAAMRIANHTTDWVRTAGAIDPDIEKDGMPYVFTTDGAEGATYIHRVLLSEPGLGNEVMDFFAGEGFRVLVNTLEESCINAFVLRLKDIGATCRKKVLVLAVAEHIVNNFGVAKEYGVASEVKDVGAAGSVGVVIDNVVSYDEGGVAYDQSGVRIGAAADEELDDAMCDVIGAVKEGGYREIDEDGDATMVA